MMKCKVTHDFIMVVTKLLSNELVAPFLGLASIVRHDTWNYERHSEGFV